MQVEVTREDQNVFLTVNGISATSETAARLYQGLAFTWEVEQLARHRHQARAEVVREIVDWLRVQQHGRTSDNYPGYFARQIEAKFGGRDASA